MFFYINNQIRCNTIAVIISGSPNHCELCLFRKQSIIDLHIYLSFVCSVIFKILWYISLHLLRYVTWIISLNFHMLILELVSSTSPQITMLVGPNSTCSFITRLFCVNCLSIFLSSRFSICLSLCICCVPSRYGRQGLSRTYCQLLHQVILSPQRPIFTSCSSTRISTYFT